MDIKKLEEDPSGESVLACKLVPLISPTTCDKFDKIVPGCSNYLSISKTNIVG